MRFVVILAGFILLSAALSGEMEPNRTLDDFQWKQRLLIAHVPAESSVQGVVISLDRYASETLDRKLVVLIVHGNEWVMRNLSEPPRDPEALRQVILKRLDGHDIALIGLDGGTKALYDWDDFSLESVFALIDRMPMRRTELDARKPSAQ